MSEAFFTREEHEKVFVRKVDDEIDFSADDIGSKILLFRFSPDVASKRGLTAAEMSAVEAIHRAVEFNPHVPKVKINISRQIQYAFLFL